MKLCATILLLLLWGCSSPAQKPQGVSDPTSTSPEVERDKGDEKFIAEVEHGEDFEREFGNGLVFRLAASKDPVTPGWTIEIRPKDSNDPEVELSWVATPPYRGQNPRYLDVSYGNSAAQSVELKPRRFSFLRNPADFANQAAAVRAALWPPTQEEFKKALDRIGTAPQCDGTLRILDHRLSRPADAAVEWIEWLKFEVELCSKLP